MECSNYRGVSLLCTTYKVFSNILFTRLSSYAENIIGDYQCGFRKDRSTIEQIFNIRQILEKTREFQINTYHLFIDFQTTYDSIIRDLLIDALRQFNIPEKGEPHTCALRPGAEDSTDWATAALHEMLTFMLKFFSF